jgi:hypothetical protein
MQAKKRFLWALALGLLIVFCNCQSENCDNTLSWTPKKLKGILFQPTRVLVGSATYCGYDFYLKQWSGLPMAVRFDDDFLKGEIFQVGDTLFLKSSKNIISPFIFWNKTIQEEYSVKTTVISRYIEDDFKEGKSQDFDFMFSRDTLFSFNGDTLQRLRMKNFNRYNGASLVLVINKRLGVEGVYISTNKSDGESEELIFSSEGNIYLATIPNAVMFDPKRMSIE